MDPATVNGQVVPNEELMQKFLATHKPDGKEFVLQPLLDVVEDTIRHAKAWLRGKDKEVSKVDPNYQLDDLLHDSIKMVSCEFSCKCSGDPNIIKLLERLESYSWEARAAIILAGFAANLGSYCLVAQLNAESHPFAKSLALLQLPPNVLMKQSSLRPTLEELLEISEVVLGLIKVVVKAKIKFQPVYENYWVNAVSLITHSILACASEMLNTVAKGIGAQGNAGKLSGLAKRIKKMRSHLEEDIQEWIKRNEKIVVNEKFGKLKKRLEETTIKNSIDFLLVLISFNDNQWTLYHPSANTEGGERPHPWLLGGCKCSTCLTLRNKLTNKHVMLYISNLEDLSEDEYSLLHDKYKRKSTEYEIVWIPIVDKSTSWNVEMEKQFKKIRNSVTWFSISDPSKLDKALIKYITKVWKFQEKSRFVVLDLKGEVEISCDIDLFWIWKGDEKIGKLTTIQLLWEFLGSQVDDWVKKEKYIFLFGGEDVDWIKRFIAAVRAVVKATKMDYVMWYVGKSAMKWERHLEVKSHIQGEVGRFTKMDMSAFWTTLQSLWHTKMETGKSIVEETTMKDIVTFLGFDAAGGGWAAVGHSSRRTMAKLQGAPLIEMLEKYADKTKKAAPGKPVEDLVDEVVQIASWPTESDHKCYSWTLPATKGTTLLRAECIYCHKPMKASITYRCCNDE